MPIAFAPVREPDVHYRQSASCAEPCRLLTNVVAYPWSHFDCGGPRHPPFDYHTIYGRECADRRLQGRMLDGGAWTVQDEFQAPRILVSWNALSIWVFMAWALLGGLPGLGFRFASPMREP